VTVITDSDVASDGLKEGSVENLVGATKSYASDALANGTIDAADDDGALGDCTLLHETATASASNMHVDVSRTSDSAVSVHLFGGASNPLVAGAPAIDWDFIINIDASGSTPQYTLQGTWDGFPAVEIYINGESIYVNSPGPGPYSFTSDLIKLFPGIGDVTVNQSGTINSAARALVLPPVLPETVQLTPAGERASDFRSRAAMSLARPSVIKSAPPSFLKPCPGQFEELLGDQTLERYFNDRFFESLHDSVEWEAA
jgi:hypothetical protein